jgi:hypothetical protein
VLHRAAPLDFRTANPALDIYQQTSCHFVNRLKPLSSFCRLRQAVNFSDTGGRQQDHPPPFSMSTNLQRKPGNSAAHLPLRGQYRTRLLTVEQLV